MTKSITCFFPDISLCFSYLTIVISAKAEIHETLHWTSAFAGATTENDDALSAVYFFLAPAPRSRPVGYGYKAIRTGIAYKDRQP
ncbi:hypothetical protein [Zobellella endophytica]|uniref:hypothetical protein n=1 Tax=Zobellella endophytica TaxID=2116700 RepID=UPI0011B1F926|nr:hypothetical protein [Zobellella endophytica]